MATQQRDTPIGIGLVCVVAVLGGLAAILVGALIAASAGSTLSGTAMVIGAAIAFAGVLTFPAAYGLWTRRRWGWLLMVGLAVVLALGGAAGTLTGDVKPIAGTVVGLGIVGYLAVERELYLGGSSADRPPAERPAGPPIGGEADEGRHPQDRRPHTDDQDRPVYNHDRQEKDHGRAGQGQGGQARQTGAQGGRPRQPGAGGGRPRETGAQSGQPERPTADQPGREESAEPAEPDRTPADDRETPADRTGERSQPPAGDTPGQEDEPPEQSGGPRADRPPVEDQPPETDRPPVEDQPPVADQPPAEDRVPAEDQPPGTDEAPTGTQPPADPGGEPVTEPGGGSAPGAAGRCPSCGNDVEPDWQFCKQCGEDLTG